MRFRVLGNVEAYVDDTLIDVGHPRQRAVLAILLVETGKPVSAGQLIDRIWGESVPQRARETLRSYVSRLRTALAEAGTPIQRQPGGHLLAVDPATVDLHRFRQLAAEARSATDDTLAARLWQQALELWRGEAFQGVDTPWLRQLAAALDGERFAATLARNDALLRCGQHAQLLPDLSAAADAHPYDERLAGQLMLALYRAGRQADALALYRSLHKRLADELGSPPGPELRRLHQQVLRQDPELALPAAAREEPVPAQLPADIAAFAGRVTHLERLDRLLPGPGHSSSTVVISAIGGTAGIGKTSLAIHWAHRVRERFPDGQLYVNLRGFDPAGQITAPAEALRGFLDALGVPADQVPAGLDAQAGRYRSLLAGRRMLILLDNARDADQVRPLLPGGAGSVVLVTSRNQLTGLVTTDGAHPLALDLLSHDEARQLLTARLGTARVAAEPDATSEIIRGCARLPLALAIAAARAATTAQLPLRALAAELSDVSHTLDALDSGDPTTDVRAVFSWSYRTLSTGAARLFRLLGLHPGPDISAAAAAALAGEPVPQIRPRLAELTRAQLLTEATAGRYSQHDLLHAYATELTASQDAESDRHAARTRLVDHYLHTAHAAGQLIDPRRESTVLGPPVAGASPARPTDHDQAMAWLTTEYVVLLALLDHMARAGLDVRTVQLARVLGQFLDWYGDWHGLVAAQITALRTARHLADRPAQAYAHLHLSHAYGRLGRYEDALAHAQPALEIYQSISDQAGQNRGHRTLSWLYTSQGRYPESLHHARQTLQLSRALGDPRGEAVALNNLGMLCSDNGDHGQAVTYCRQALALLQQDDDPLVAHVWDSLGQVYQRLDDHQQAIACYQRAVDACRTAGLKSDEAEFRIRFGEACLTAGDRTAAATAWRPAVTILDELDPPRAGELRSRLKALGHGVAPGHG